MVEWAAHKVNKRTGEKIPIKSACKDDWQAMLKGWPELEEDWVRFVDMISNDKDGSKSVLVKVKHARFRGFARPGDQLEITVTLEEKVGEVFDFRGQIVVGGKKIMQNEFQLTNILSKTLQG